MINIISAEYLRKVKTGVTLIEPTHVLQGITGNRMNTLGKIIVPVFVDSIFKFEVTAVVVENLTFPDDLLIGYDTMKEEDIALFPARGGARIAFRFIPFISKGRKAELLANVTESQVTNNNESDKSENLNNVAERSRHTTSVAEAGHVEQQYTTPVVDKTCRRTAHNTSHKLRTCRATALGERNKQISQQ